MLSKVTPLQFPAAGIIKVTTYFVFWVSFRVQSASVVVTWLKYEAI